VLIMNIALGDFTALAAELVELVRVEHADEAVLQATLTEVDAARSCARSVLRS
jgi:hypothetical protein